MFYRSTRILWCLCNKCMLPLVFPNNFTMKSNNEWSPRWRMSATVSDYTKDCLWSVFEDDINCIDHNFIMGMVQYINDKFVIVYWLSFSSIGYRLLIVSITYRILLLQDIVNMEDEREQLIKRVDRVRKKVSANLFLLADHSVWCITFFLPGWICEKSRKVNIVGA